MGGSQKRKLPEEYSTNKNTIRERKRIAKGTPEQTQYRLQKKSDEEYLRRARVKLENSVEYKTATKNQRQFLLLKSIEDCTKTR
jgi:hypothetical protein